MFENLSDRLERIYKKLKGRGVLKEADVDEALREIRVALIEADVSKDEEFGFGANVNCVGHASAFQVIDRLAGNVTRVSRVVFPRDGILNVRDNG